MYKRRATLKLRNAFAKWGFALVPLVGLAELVAHAAQVASIVPDADWVSARAVAARALRPDDLLVFAPSWAEPVGRHHFGDDLATAARMARPDVTRFPRALVVSIRGARIPELDGWKKVGEERAGKVTLTTLENPTPARVLTDLVNEVEAGRAEVQRVEGATASPCARRQGSAETGNIGFGPAVPGNRYVCARGGFAGVTVLPDLTYAARRCIYVPPPGGGAAVHLRFGGVRFGRSLHGHHAISVHAERERTGAPVSLAFRAGDRVLGRLVHKDGDGWKSFELDTRELEGQTGELVAEVSSSVAANRQYCFEADTR